MKQILFTVVTITLVVILKLTTEFDISSHILLISGVFSYGILLSGRMAVSYANFERSSIFNSFLWTILSLLAVSAMSIALAGAISDDITYGRRIVRVNNSGSVLATFFIGLVANIIVVRFTPEPWIRTVKRINTLLDQYVYMMDQLNDSWLFITRDDYFRFRKEKRKLVAHCNETNEILIIIFSVTVIFTTLIAFAILRSSFGKESFDTQFSTILATSAVIFSITHVATTKQQAFVKYCIAVSLAFFGYVFLTLV